MPPAAGTEERAPGKDAVENLLYVRFAKTIFDGGHGVPAQRRLHQSEDLAVRRRLIGVGAQGATTPGLISTAFLR